ncbi:hypothetical protein GRF59_25530 [Paenibacillus sp. HJL G12]|uniref:Uncharacterized protein n=1 Tax=Paenibacillus dendrobii TaxID=2691084 RepID=A0A7X3INV8_9BACL|nr:hypothetical protein [Paenibacillus dendrobii]MWV46978.1 hypothetical protein [Paenibacillus dendrobii]
MNTRIDIAVANNIIWCAMVCDIHGIVHTSTAHLWGVQSRAPEFYPDIITSERDATSEEVMAFIGSRSVASIKDSYANLDLFSYGFRILFEAEWIYHDPEINSEFFSSSWHVITSEQDLSRWTAANGLEGVIRQALLQQENVKIFMHETHDGISGFIASLGANAVGISNVFTTAEVSEGIWLDIVNSVAASFPGLPMVGYELNASAALLSGWSSAGPLRVWLKEE